ncbi:MAG: DUF190 domain-containing protein [Candidatus Marinimicrobia bacterium]|nr:DUF190 domain-containing protein [Candidatus Neomarinimicrobiota bacterium]MCF7922274.1 DUF190 domain-containing protein [Candidatus Neomarinimicrobiota bacterium]
MLEYFAGQKLCVFISKNDKYEGIVLYELLLEIAFNSRLSGGTVTIGDKGFFGDQNESTKLKILRSSENLPVVLEFQGRTNRINRYIERIQPLIKEGLLTLTEVQITKFNSSDEDPEDFEDKKNEDQAKIFDENNNTSNRPEPQQENPEESLKERARDSNPSDSEVQREAGSQPQENESVNSAFLEPDEDPKIKDDSVEPPEPDVEIPLFDDNVEQTFETLEKDQEAIPEAEEEEGDEEETDTPEFQTFDDDPLKHEAVDDQVEDESADFIKEEFEEDDSVLQLTDLSETQAEESVGERLEMDDLDETVDKTSKGSEYAKPQTDEDLDALFEESTEHFESTFDDMLKQAGKASGVDVDLDSENEKTVNKEPGESAGESVEPKATRNDKDHTEEDVKNYFSALFRN